MPLTNNSNFGMSEEDARKLFVKIILANNIEELANELGHTGEERTFQEFVQVFLRNYVPDETDESNIRKAQEIEIYRSCINRHLKERNMK